MNLPYSIIMYWTIFWQPTVKVQQNTFENTLFKVGSQHLYASFATFRVQIGQLFEAQWNFKLSEAFSFENSDLTIFNHFSKAHCDSNNWPIWTQKMPKEA